MVARIAARGALAGLTVARVKTALGKANVFDADWAQRTYSQVGNFAGARRVAGGAITAFGPDAAYPAGRVEARTLDYARAVIDGGLGYQLEPGSTKFAMFKPAEGQSNCAAAGDGSFLPQGYVEPGPYNVIPPLPDRLFCFNGGIRPLNAQPGNVSLNVALTPADIASVVPAACAINALNQRDYPLFSAALMVADALRGTPHIVFCCAFPVGSTSLSERLLGFTGARASGTVTITGTTAAITVTAATPGLNVADLFLIGTGIAAGTQIVGSVTGDPTGSCTATVNISQTVGPVAFTTKDQRPQQYKNFVMALDAFAAWARANGYTPIMPDLYFIGGEAEGDTSAKANGIVTLKSLQTVVNEFTARLYAGTVNEGKTATIIDAVVNLPRNDPNHDPASNEGLATPFLGNMGRVSNMALAALAMDLEVTAAGARHSTSYIAIASYFCAADADARAHFGPDPALLHKSCGGFIL